MDHKTLQPYEHKGLKFKMRARFLCGFFFLHQGTKRKKNNVQRGCGFPASYILGASIRNLLVHSGSLTYPAFLLDNGGDEKEESIGLHLKRGMKIIAGEK